MHSLHRNRVLIAGAAGFVGANLAAQLTARGAEVHGLVRTTTDLRRLEQIASKISLHQCDVTQRDKLTRVVQTIRPHIIYNVVVSRAERLPAERIRTLETNINGTLNLLEDAALIDCERFVQVGSSTEYGARNEPLKESDCPQPSLFFSATKAAATLLCQQFARVSVKPIVTLRLFNVYGYWERPARLIPTAIMAALRGHDLPLTLPGYRRDYVFIEDVIEACLLALRAESVSGEIINVGSGVEHSNEEVVDIIRKLSGRAINVRVGECEARPADTAHWVADTRKARKLLGWEPRHSLRDGLLKTLEWVSRHQDFYLPTSGDASLRAAG